MFVHLRARSECNPVVVLEGGCFAVVRRVFMSCWIRTAERESDRAATATLNRASDQHDRPLGPAVGGEHRVSCTDWRLTRPALCSATEPVAGSSRWRTADSSRGPRLAGCARRTSCEQALGQRAVGRHHRSPARRKAPCQPAVRVQQLDPTPPLFEAKTVSRSLGQPSSDETEQAAAELNDAPSSTIVSRQALRHLGIVHNWSL